MCHAAVDYDAGMDERPGSRLVADRRVAARPLVGRPVAARPVVRRLPGLLIGLIVFGLGIALMVQAGLGLGPWEAFHQGLARLTGPRPGAAAAEG